MSDCPRFGKLIKGCKFEPRYDTGPADLNGLSVKGASPSILEQFRRVTYVADVCVTCGKVIKRENP